MSKPIPKPKSKPKASSGNLGGDLGGKLDGELSGELSGQLDQLNNFVEQVTLQIKNATDLSELDNLRVSVLGKKGKLTEQLKQLGSLPKELRPKVGQQINVIKVQLNELITSCHANLTKQALDQKLAQEKIDVTLSGRADNIGSKHPIRQVMHELTSFFKVSGFDLAIGPEIEADYFNFEALNVPEHHPARAAQDTFYFDAKTLLRTHTSSVQTRVMDEIKAPVRIISPGRVYRSDAEDSTHTPMFHQLEGLWVDKHASFADLKGLLLRFLHDFFGKEVKVRFRPSYFPFTTPSAEVDIGYLDSNNKIKWLEILGCGMVHPNVLESCGIDYNKYRGFAFGVGIERLAMLKYNISDIRLFYENDQRFLKQFVKLV